MKKQSQQEENKRGDRIRERKRETKGKQEEKVKLAAKTAKKT